VKIGAFAAFMTGANSPEALLTLARSLEDAGMESLWLGEHVMLFDEMEFPYPGSADGKLSLPAGSGIPDQATTIAFLASATRRLRFGTGISLISQRNPIYTAKEFATLDWLSGGRVDLGVGVGWCKEEVEACGYSWHDRGRRCDEALELMIKLWTEPVVEFTGKHFQVHGARMQPQPTQRPHIPLVIGGYSRAAMVRTARYGQGWLGFGLDPATTRMMLKSLDGALAEAGRTRSDIEIVMMPGVDDEDSARAFRDLGVDRLVPLITTDAVSAPVARLRHLERLAKLGS